MSRSHAVRSRRAAVPRVPQAVLFVALAATALGAVACGIGGGGGSAELAQPAALWETPAQFQGHLVRTTGVVQAFQVGTPDEHDVVEDPARHRVELLGVSHERLAALVGHTVEVVGRFHFSGTTGYTLDVQSIAAVG